MTPEHSTNGTEQRSTTESINVSISRRDALKTVGAAGTIGVFGTGTATAQRPERHIVGTQPGRADVARRQATQVDKTLDFGGIGQAVVGRWPEQALQGLQNNPHVRYVEEDFEVVGFEQEVPWGIERVDARIANAVGDTGENIHVAVLDSGIRSTHPDLEAHLGTGHALIECDPDHGSCDEDWDDDQGHGTHVAGTVGALDNDIDVVGVAPEVTLHSVKVLDHTNRGPSSGVAEGLKLAADEGYDVANMSLGSASQSSATRDAVQYADDEGVVIVASAGNDGDEERCDENDCVGYPAAEPETIAVGNTTSNDTIASSSSTGPEVDIAAPGSGILSTTRDGGTGHKSGTSMAAPHVAGAAALLLASGTSPGEVRTVLQDTAEDLGLEDFEQGAGLLDVANALGHDFPQPEAAFTYSPELPNENEEVQFDATVSTPQNTIETYEWDFEVEGQTEDAEFIEAGPTPTHTFELGVGSYFTALRVTDAAGQSDVVTQFIEINGLPVADFEIVTDPPLRNESVVFDASKSDDIDGFVESYEWDFGDGTTKTTPDPVIEHTYEEGGEKTVRLRVTDDDGASDDEISVHEERLTVNIRVTVDVKPGENGANSIHLRNEGNIPVAALQAADFDASNELDPSSVRFGAPGTVDSGDGAVPVHEGGHIEDVNENGDDDWLCHFPVEDTGFERGDEEGKLVGETTDGVPVFGSDDVRIVGRP